MTPTHRLLLLPPSPFFPDSSFSFFASLSPRLQTQRLAVEHKKIPQEPASRVSLWRGPSGDFALVNELLVAHRPAATQGGHGVGTSKWNCRRLLKDEERREKMKKRKKNRFRRLKFTAVVKNLFALFVSCLNFPRRSFYSFFKRHWSRISNTKWTARVRVGVWCWNAGNQNDFWWDLSWWVVFELFRGGGNENSSDLLKCWVIWLRTLTRLSAINLKIVMSSVTAFEYIQYIERQLQELVEDSLVMRLPLQLTIKLFFLRLKHLKQPSNFPMTSCPTKAHISFNS